MPSSIVMAWTSTPFLGPNTEDIIFRATMLSLPPETATAILSPCLTSICFLISRLTLRST